MSSKKTVSEDELALFRNAVGTVKSVKNDRIGPRQPDARPKLRHAEQDDRTVMDELLHDLSEADLLETGEHLSYTQPGVQRSVLKKLKSGRYSVQAEVDLHGMTIEQARQILGEFLRNARQRRHLCVRIIHGKGRKRSDQAPRLKPAVNHWLQRNKAVMAFCSAPANDGGTGAVYVLLKRLN